jgi:hypothetical protein
MKAIILTIILLPVFCFSQDNMHRNPTEPIQAATNSCPSWKKNKPSTKANYFQYLRSGKLPKDQSMVYYGTPGSAMSKEEVPSQKISKEIPKEEKRTSSSQIPVVAEMESKNTLPKEPEKKTEAITSDNIKATDKDILTKEKSKEEREKDKKRTKRVLAKRNNKAPKANNAKCPVFL